MKLAAATPELVASLREVGTPERAIKEKAYLKSELEHLGATVPQTREAAKKLHRRFPDATHDEVTAAVDELWGLGIHEARAAAVELLWFYRKLLDPADLPLLERLLRESRTWALLDALAIGTVGMLVEEYPEGNRTLDRWATDDDFWIRRAAMLALLKPLRRGAGDFERFGRYADSMLEEKEFFIRKAIGWVLRETARKQPELVVEWLIPRAQRASGLTIREAVKPLTVVDADRIRSAHTGESN